MPTNRTLFIAKYFCLLVLFSLPIILSAQVSTYLNQSFNIEAAQFISIQVNSTNLKIKYTQGTRILVETKVSLSIDNLTLLHFITQKGRYDLIKKLDANTKCLKLVPKNKQNLILIKGKELQENISYTIYIPQKMAFVDLANK
ncbi:MAG: hypothetical protein JKY03_07140 [Aureispira sp.]|nr:hypothetical protein [Aureispira sp.]